MPVVLDEWSLIHSLHPRLRGIVDLWEVQGTTTLCRGWQGWCRVLLSPLPKPHFLANAISHFCARQSPTRICGQFSSQTKPSSRLGTQEVADWVCAGLDILGLVCVGVFASPCAVTESVVSVAYWGSGTLLLSASISFDST
jgi:hypothetical protein